MSRPATLPARRDLLPAALLAALAVGLLAWAEWLPCADEVPALAGSRDLGPPLVREGGSAWDHAVGHLAAPGPPRSPGC